MSVVVVTFQQTSEPTSKYTKNKNNGANFAFVLLCVHSHRWRSAFYLPQLVTNYSIRY